MASGTDEEGKEKGEAEKSRAAQGSAASEPGIAGASEDEDGETAGSGTTRASSPDAAPGEGEDEGGDPPTPEERS